MKQVPAARVYHVDKGVPEYRGDDSSAILFAARAKPPYKRIDLNGLLCKRFPSSKEARLPVNEHYPLPLKHGFKDPLKRLRVNTPISEMSWDEVERLVAAGQYRIDRMNRRLNMALRNGLDPEHELKCFMEQAILERLHSELDEPERVWVKTLLDLVIPHEPKPWERLTVAHDVGHPTIILCHEPNMELPRTASRKIDYFRGHEPRLV